MLLLLLLPAESVGLLLACLAVISLLASRKVLLRELARLRAQKTVIQYLTLNPMLTVWQVSNPDGENMIARPATAAELAEVESADGDGEATVPGSPSTASTPSTPGSALSRYAPWRIFRRSARVQPDSLTGDSSDVSPAAEGTELSSPA